MHAEIHDAAATRERRVIEPGLVRPVGIVEDEVSREDTPQLSGAEQGSRMRRIPSVKR